MIFHIAGWPGAAMVAVPDHPHQGAPVLVAGHDLVCNRY